MRHREEEEPEWFTSGPSSRSDTIELHGFERECDSSAEQGRHVREEPEGGNDQPGGHSSRCPKKGCYWIDSFINFSYGSWLLLIQPSVNI